MDKKNLSDLTIQADLSPEFRELLLEIPKLRVQLAEMKELIINRNNDDFLDFYVPLELALRKISISKRQYYILLSKGSFPKGIRIGAKTYLTRQMIKEMMDRHTIKR